MPNPVRQVRNRRLRRGIRMEPAQWFIGKNINRTTFYVAEHDSKENVTLWTPKRKESIAFHNERAAHKYLTRYLHNRTDVILVTVVDK